MNLYLIYCKAHTDWYIPSTYDRAVVCAKNKKEAAGIHPSGKDNWGGAGDTQDTWTAKGNVVVKLLGVAAVGSKPGVICASLRAPK